VYSGDIQLGDTIDIKFTTRQFSTGAPFLLAGSPVVSAYVGNGTTEITAGITLSANFDSVTGLNNVRVVASGGNGFAAQTNVDLVITTGTVDSVSVVGEVIGSFSIQNRPVNVLQVNGTAQTAKDIGAAVPAAAPGAAGGLFIAGTNAPVTITGSGAALTLTSTGGNGQGMNITGQGTGAGVLINAGSGGKGINILTTAGDGISVEPTGGHAMKLIGNGTAKHGLFAIGASAGATSDGINATAGNGGVDIRGAITGNITGNLSGSVNSVTTGVLLAAAAVQAIWDALTSALTTAGSIGKLIVDNLNATITSRMATYTQPTGFLAATFPSGTIANTTNITAGTMTTTTNLTNAPTVGDLTSTMKGSVEDAVWDAVLASHATAGSTGAALAAAGSAGDPWSTDIPGSYTGIQAGKVVGDALDAAVSSRLAPTVAARTLDVTATGAAGIDFGNVENQGTTVGLSGTTIKAVTDAGTLTSGERNSVADALLDRTNGIETGSTPRGALRLMLAALAGKLSGAAGTTVTFRNAVADSKDRIVATVTADGNRTAVTTDQT